ncbi:MAG: hypothetical protein IJY51_00485 [Treponema sp.]|uniref:pectate lyase family protein n=1 Tax=Treponema sp. TaxID=166 RepID=UPI0025808BB3|nr:hypothetical protein [Treponema sp.]MBQ9101547.1 hypothetical protein [Treponema sp.]
MKKLTRLAAILASTAILFSAISCKTDDGNSGEESGPSDGTNADGTTTLKINENDKASGFVSAFATDGTTAKINTANVSDYLGSGYLDNPGKVVYSVNSEKEQNVKIQIRYAHWGWSYQIKAAYVQINGENCDDDAEILYGNWTGKFLSLSNTITVSLKAGDNQICLLPVPKGKELPKYDETKGFGVKYPNGEQDEASAEIEAGKSVAGKYLSDGMIPNLDYISITGTGIKNGSGQSATYYQIKTSVNNEDYGSIDFSPEQDSYVEGTEVTVTATPKAGYIFDSWCGTNTDTTGSFKVKVDSDKTFKANFIPVSFDKTTELAGLEGYASVCDDSGSVYTITGGFGGDEITISSYAELLSNKSKISGDEPAIIRIGARISSAEWIGTDDYNKELASLIARGKEESEAKFILKNRSFYFDVGSNKTLVGESGKDYGFKNINVKISGSNVIVKNLHFGDVIGEDYFGGSGNDAMSIKGGEHVWIDHCEFSSSLTPVEVDGTAIDFSKHNFEVDLEGENCTEEEKWTKDFYDGLLDISETSRFISVSNSYFHDHWKACLCGGSNDNASSQPQGSLVRLSMYNNYFEKIHARQPLFRFGKAHIYSSYLKGLGDSSSGIEVRAESRVYVDNVYFEDINSDKTVGCWNSSKGLGAGKWTVKECEGASFSNNAGFTPPYNWTKTSASDSKANLPASAGISK